MNLDKFASLVAKTANLRDLAVGQESLLKLYAIADTWAKQGQSLIALRAKEHGYRKLLQVYALLELEPVRFLTGKMAHEKNTALRVVAKKFICSDATLKQIAIESKRISWLSQQSSPAKLTVLVTEAERKIFQEFDQFLEQYLDYASLRKKVHSDAEVLRLCELWHCARHTNVISYAKRR